MMGKLRRGIGGKCVGGDKKGNRKGNITAIKAREWYEREISRLSGKYLAPGLSQLFYDLGYNQARARERQKQGIEILRLLPHGLTPLPIRSLPPSVWRPKTRTANAEFGRTLYSPSGCLPDPLYTTTHILWLFYDIGYKLTTTPAQETRNFIPYSQPISLSICIWCIASPIGKTKPLTLPPQPHERNIKPSHALFAPPLPW